MVMQPTLMASQRQFEYNKFNANIEKLFSPKLLSRILRHCTLIVLGHGPKLGSVQLKFVCATYIFSEKDTEHIANLMRTLKIFFS